MHIHDKKLEESFSIHPFTLVKQMEGKLPYILWMAQQHEMTNNYHTKPIKTTSKGEQNLEYHCVNYVLAKILLCTLM